jgi:ABC-type multidrug transport system fused ATPase/permease subunit
MRGMKVMWEMLGEKKKTIAWILAAIAVGEIIGLSVNVLLKFLIDEIPRLTKTGSLSPYAFALIAALASAKLFQLVFKRFVLEMRFIKALIALENHWPAIAHRKLMELSLGYHERENTGKKIDKINKGCERMIDVMGRLRWGFVPQLFYLAFNMAIIMIMDWRLGLLFFAPFPAAAWFYLHAFRKAAPVFEEWEIKKEEATGLFCQSVLNIQTVQNYAQEWREMENFSAIRKEMARIDTEASISMQYNFFAAISLLWMFFIGTVLFGIILVIRGQAPIGTVVYIISTGSVTLEGLWQLVHEYTEILRRLIAVFRMKKLLDEEPDIADDPEAAAPDRVEGTIELKDLSFSYPHNEREVLDRISFKIRPGQMVALVGKSGEGKTTMVKLICRMFDPTGGAVLLDGRDARALPLHWYRRLFAIVQQNVDIFDASILDNVRYSRPDATEAQAASAIRAASLEIVLKDKARFPHGLREQVGEKGVRLSGGERQRVGIARAYLALMSGARFLVLDEATSNLDSQAEQAIQKMLMSIRKKRNITIIAIAHRLSTIQKADKICVISAGRIAEQGDHARLLEKNGLYAQLASLQKLGELRK